MPPPAPPPPIRADIAFSSRIRPSPFFKATLRWGARIFTTYNHTFMPTVYESPEADYRHLTQAVTLWDVAGERQTEITGPDAARFAQYLTPRPLSTCAVNRCRYILMTQANGGVINDPVLLRLAQDRFWLSAADSDILLWCQGVALNAGFDVTVRMPDASPLQLQGPRSTETAIALFGEWVADLDYFHLRQFDFEGVPLVLSRTGWSGERGYEIYLCDGEAGDWLWERIMSAGKPHGIKPAAPSAIRRLEAGMLSYGADVNQEDTPFHLGLGRLTDVDGDFDFIGKQALQKVKQEGTTRRLVGIRWGKEPMPNPLVRWWNVTNDKETRIGKVRSAIHSPTLGTNIGLAMIDHPHDATGGTITIHPEEGGSHQATICEPPFIAHKTH